MAQGVVLLSRAGFESVRNAPVGFHFFHDGGDGLRADVEYVLEFLEPGVPDMAALGVDEVRLRRGLEHLRSIPERHDGSLTHIVYRARAVNPERGR